MHSMIDDRTKLTGNQKKLLFVAVAANMLEAFDFFLIGFVLAFIAKTWTLTFTQSAIMLVTSGLGAIVGAFAWGYIADRIGRRPSTIATLLLFSFATGALMFAPDGGWRYVSVCRFFVGIGAGGIYSVTLPLVLELVPSSRRGTIAGLFTTSIGVGVILGALSGGFLESILGWRGLFALGVLPAVLVFFIRPWMPESPLWLLNQGRTDDAKKSMAWVLELEPSEIVNNARTDERVSQASFWEIFRYPRSLVTSWSIMLSGQTVGYGVALWAPTLFVLSLNVTPADAAKLWIAVSISGLIGRSVFAFASDRIGRRASGVIFGLGAATALVLAAFLHDQYVGTIPVLWLLLVIWALFGDGGFAVIGPYSAEIWPTSIRAAGIGSANGFGGLGKILGPLSLALIAGGGGIVNPQASIDAILPAFLFFAAFYCFAALIFVFVGIETRGKSFEQIDALLQNQRLE